MTETSRSMPEGLTAESDRGLRRFLLREISERFRQSGEQDYSPLFGINEMSLSDLKRLDIHATADAANEKLLPPFEVVWQVLQEQGYSAGTTYKGFMCNPLYLTQQELHALLLDAGPHYGVITGAALADRFLDLVKKL